MGCLCLQAKLLTDHLITGEPLMSEPAQEKWFSQTIHTYKPYYYSPALKKWGYTGFTLSFRRSVLPLFRYSVHNSVTTHNLRTSCKTLTKFGICINIDNINLCINACQFPQICIRVIALGWPYIDIRISFPLNIFRTN